MRSSNTHFVRELLGVLIACAVFGVLFWWFLILVCSAGDGRDGYTAPVYADTASPVRIDESARFEIYIEGEGEPPEWYRPDEPMAVEWTADDIICGWGNRKAEEWEMDLLSRIFYLEFWGTSDTCCEAGCDAILNLWESGLFGKTLGEALSAKNAQGKYVYSTFPSVRSTVYDADGLKQCRAYCEERFKTQPEWCGSVFKLGGYHDTIWSIPVYEIDGVYFSMLKRTTRPSN